MVAVGADFEKCNRMAQGNLQADFPKGRVYIGVEDSPPILGPADHMVQKNRDIVALANESAHALR